MTHTITAALASSARREDDMNRRDFLKAATGLTLKLTGPYDRETDCVFGSELTPNKH